MPSLFGIVPEKVKVLLEQLAEIYTSGIPTRSATDFRVHSW
jgi:hypothetical protein